MISGEKIGQYIANPHAISREDVKKLEELSLKFPYCSSLQILHLKGLAISNDLNFERQLRKTAIHAPDRQHLYTLIHTTGHQDSAEIETKPEKEPVQTQITTSELAEAQPIDNQETEKEEVSTPALPIENEPEAEDLAPPEENVEPENKPIHAESSEQENESIPEERLTADILTNAIDIAYADSEIPVKKEPEAEEAQTNGERIAEKEPTPAAGKEPDQPKEELSFIEWLKLKQQKQHTVQETPEPATTTPPEAATTANTALAEDEKESEPASSATENNDINALLEKFIREEPRISKPVKAFYNPARNAKKSIEDSEDLVSETLAQIHVIQRNYRKAIDAYEKLILLYPEKKAFFASQIKKIREEIKNK